MNPLFHKNLIPISQKANYCGVSLLVSLASGRVGHQTISNFLIRSPSTNSLCRKRARPKYRGARKPARKDVCLLIREAGGARDAANNSPTNIVHIKRKNTDISSGKQEL